MRSQRGLSAFVARRTSTRPRSRMSAGFCCCAGGDTDPEREAATATAKTNGSGAAIAATFGKSEARQQHNKAPAAPAGHAGLSPPKAASMSDNAPVADASASHFGSDGDADEFFDAPDSLEHLGPKWGSPGHNVSELLAAEGIVLEQSAAPVVGVGRCVVPRHDIPFEDPSAGKALSWSANPTGEGFKLRGKDYMRDKKKFPSATPLFDVVQVLALRSDHQTLDFGHLLFGGDVGEMVHGCPTVYIANVMLPDYTPPNPVWGKYDRVAGPDGPGQHIVVVARMTAGGRTSGRIDEQNETKRDETTFLPLPLAAKTVSFGRPKRGLHFPYFSLSAHLLRDRVLVDAVTVGCCSRAPVGR